MCDTYRSRHDQALTPLAAYFRDIQQIPLPAVDKEKALARRGCAGDVAALVERIDWLRLSCVSG